MKLIPITERDDAALILWDLLAERPKEACISHKAMPSWDRHLDHIENWPRLAWYLIYSEEFDEFVGSTYVDAERRVGMDILARWRNRGLGEHALKLLRAAHPGPLLANIAPTNDGGRRFWQRHGARKVQETYLLEPT